MKIVILVRILWSAGAPKKAIREAKELTQIGHKVELVFLRRSMQLNTYDDLLKDLNWRVITDHNSSILVPLYDYLTGLFSPDRKGEGRLDYNLIRRFPSYIAKDLPDLVICHDQFSGFAGYYAKKKFGIPYIVLMHERVDSNKTGILVKLADHYIKKILVNACGVIASTEKIAKSVRSKYNIACETNYQGFDKVVFKNYFEKENAIIAVSMWDSGRNSTIYLDIIEKLRTFKLFMVGNWRSEKLYENFKEEIKKRSLVDKVLLFRNISEKELNNLYDRAKFVMRFGFGEFGESHAFFEGLQRGLPIIMNSDLGSSEIAKRYAVGLVMNEINTSDILEFITKSDDAVSYTEIQNRILQLIGDFSWESHAQNLISRTGLCLEILYKNKGGIFSAR